MQHSRPLKHDAAYLPLVTRTGFSAPFELRFRVVAAGGHQPGRCSRAKALRLLAAPVLWHAVILLVTGLQMVSRHSHSDTSRAITVVAGQRDCAGGWLQWPFARDGAALRLLCFHHAGGGAAVYRRWGHDLSSSMEVAAVQLPGRANRLTEPPIAD